MRPEGPAAEPPRQAAFGSGAALLTPRERECLRLVGENRTSKQIARTLGISQTSVDTHLRRAREKLGIRSRHQAARLLASWETRSADNVIPAPVGDGSARAGYDTRLVPPWPLPPLTELSLPQRLVLVVAAAALAAAVFGVLLTALMAI